MTGLKMCKALILRNFRDAQQFGCSGEEDFRAEQEPGRTLLRLRRRQGNLEFVQLGLVYL